MHQRRKAPEKKTFYPEHPVVSVILPEFRLMFCGVAWRRVFFAILQNAQLTR